jgi:hypothetical protein
MSEYPVTEKLKAEVGAAIYIPAVRTIVEAVAEYEHGNVGVIYIPAIRTIVDAVAEYEHGSVDVDDVCPDEPVTLEQYAAVALDLILTLMDGQREIAEQRRMEEKLYGADPQRP